MKIIKIFIVVLLVLLSLLIATVVQAADRATVVLIGGRVSDGESLTRYYEHIEESILPGEKKIVVIPERLWPFSEAAADVWQQIQKIGVDGNNGKIVIVGFSWGGLIARRIAAERPETVIAVVTVASPSGGFWACPKWIFRPGDEKSNVPLYVIAVYKEGLERWFFRGLNDGTVDIVSALDIGRKAADIVVLSGLDHMEAFISEAVINTINHWIGPYVHVDRLFASASIVKKVAH